MLFAVDAFLALRLDQRIAPAKIDSRIVLTVRLRTLKCYFQRFRVSPQASQQRGEARANHAHIRRRTKAIARR
jgi:hypothetical protein